MLDQVTEFDQAHYQQINRAREIWLRRVVGEIPFRAELSTALDVGCGAGHFSRVLHELDFAVTGVDLQADNLAICRSRHPSLHFAQTDLDRPFQLPVHDLVLMFGVLYHLQSPLTAIEQLARSVGRVGIVSTRVASGNQLALYLFRENHGPAHNTAPVTAVPTWPALLALFHLAGLDDLYLPRHQPDHPQWRPVWNGNGRRYSFVVTREPCEVSGWRRLEPGQFLGKWQPLTWLDHCKSTVYRLLRGCPPC